MVLLLFASCVTADDVITRPVEATGSGGCPAGEQPVFGPDATLVCSAIPSWPPAHTGSRAVPAACALDDGVYRLTWRRDVEDTLRPAFSVTTTLTISGEVMTLDLGSRSDWTYRYRLDWINAANANAWKPGDTDTWEFVLWRDCDRGKIRGTYTVNLPYLTDHQIETWTLESIDDQTTR